MLSQPEIALWAAPLWVALALLVPKRGWRTVRARLAATAAGERCHPFGPPLPVPDVVSWRFARLLQAELPRCLELGVPLWLATLAAEYRGFQRRRLAAAAAAATPTGWMWVRLLGRISDGELQRRLSEAGYAAPAAKAERRFRRSYSMPPMSWLRDLHVGEPEAPLSSQRATDGYRQSEPVSTIRLLVHTLGGLQIRLKGEDLTTGLLARPTVSYLWQYLLLRAIHEPGRAISRSAVADEVYPGIDPETQHARIRRRLHDLQHKLPALSRPIAITDRDLMLDPNGCEIDVLEILQLAAEAADNGPRTGLLSDAKVAALEEAIAATVSEFLPHWDDLEQTVNRGRGLGGDHVRNVRARLIDARVTLLARLGSNYLARRKAGPAVAALDEAFRLDPGRQGLAEELVKALEAVGNRSRVADVRGRYLQRE